MTNVPETTYTLDEEWIAQLKAEVFARKQGNNHLSLKKVSTIYSSFDEGNGINKTASLLGISRNTIKRYYRLGEARECKCGASLLHRGWCSFRYERSPARQAFISRWLAGRPPRIICVRTPPREVLSYPFIKAANIAAQGADLVLLVNQHVPRGLSEQLRSDVCQEILLAIISGELGVEEIPAGVKRFITQTRRLNEAHYMAFSIDQPRSDGLSWHDVIAAQESAHE